LDVEFIQLGHQYVRSSSGSVFNDAYVATLTLTMSALLPVKDTVSALYWYEELSSSKLAILCKALLLSFFSSCLTTHRSTIKHAIPVPSPGPLGEV
jgi:hypothetical protein